MSGLLAALFFFSIIAPRSALAMQRATTFSTLRESSFSSITATGRGYHYLGTAHGQGDVLSSIVGPGASASKQMFYLTYTYTSGTMDFVAIDPNSGNFHVYPSPIKSEQGAWALTAGPDNNMYIGTFPNAHLLKFNTTSQQLTDLGQIPPDPASSTHQSFLWQLTVSPHNHLLYGCTYPSADLVSYDPLDPNPRMVNLGTMDPTHQNMYTRTCTADPNPKAPYIYLGLGSVSDQLAAYNTDTNTVTFRINGAIASFGRTYLASDGSVHSWLLGSSTYQYYALSNGAYIQQSTYIPPALTNMLTDGSTIAISTSTITITHPDKSITNYPYTYSGKGLKVDRVGLGPDGWVYGGTELPYDLFTFDPNHPTIGVMMKGQIGQGEPYSLLAYNKLLYMAAYSPPNLLVYNPSNPFDATTNPTITASGNFQPDLRPVAMIGAANNTIYMGSYGSYGQLTGPLLSWNTLSNTVQESFPIQNQGVASLAATTSPCQGSSASFCLIGGTTINGGGGTTPSTATAQLFSWDPTNSLLHTYTLPNVNQPSLITDLMTDPSTGFVYGIATNQNNSYIFVFNPATGQFLNGGTTLPFYSALYNSVGIYHGSLWGLTAQGIFTINLKNVNQAALIRSRNAITAGFVMQGNTLYFASGASVWSYTMA